MIDLTEWGGVREDRYRGFIYCVSKLYSKHIKVTLRLLQNHIIITPSSHVMITTILNHIIITKQNHIKITPPN